jgi:AraC family transcriptional regulator of adaptative response / DNA-3-methyladenine glycosylase II
MLVRLPYHPPFDWHGLLRFLGARAMKGVEWVTTDTYLRTAQLANDQGWILVRHSPHDHALTLELSPSLAHAAPAFRATLRHLFDLDARPDRIAATLARDPLLAGPVAHNPGLRVPGAFDGFELAIRAILGQQITVKAAATLAGRFAQTFGESVSGATHPALTHLSPTPQRIAAAAPDELSAIGITKARAGCITGLAREVACGRLALEPGAPPETTIAQLVALPGIGAWTAHYIAMRALRWADAFPKEDIALRNSLGGASARQAEEMSQSWRPWRAYATLHLWRSRGASAAAESARPASPRRPTR